MNLTRFFPRNLRIALIFTFSVLVALVIVAKYHPTWWAGVSEDLKDPTRTAEWLAGLGTVLGVAAALWVYDRQAQKEHLQRGIDLVLKFGEDFTEDSVKAARKKTGASFHWLPKVLSEDLSEKKVLSVNDEVEVVLDFFDTLGLCVKKGAIDPDLVWSEFFYWVYRYKRLGQGAIDRQNSGRKKKDRGAKVWANFLELYETLCKLEEEARGGEPIETLTDKDIEDFAKDESLL